MHCIIFAKILMSLKIFLKCSKWTVFKNNIEILGRFETLIAFDYVWMVYVFMNFHLIF